MRKQSKNSLDHFTRGPQAIVLVIVTSLLTVSQAQMDIMAIDVQPITCDCAARLNATQQQRHFGQCCLVSELLCIRKQPRLGYAQTWIR